MKKQLLNYETMIRLTKAISHSKDPEEVALMSVESITSALDVKGCSIFLVNKSTHELEVTASFGLSKDYLSKGPISAVKSIVDSLDQGPVAIYDVTDDPRLQYPEAAKREGISSILSVPIVAGGHTIGVLRVYTAEPWEFSLEDVNFVQAMATLTGMSIVTARNYKGFKDSIEILKTMKDPKAVKSKRRTPYEGVPVSVLPGHGISAH
jgi:signal transduction protein with GAF and PtsI domain